MANDKLNPPRTSFSLFPEDEKIISEISRVTGIRAKTDCIRYALTQWARQNNVTVPINGKSKQTAPESTAPSV